MGPSVGRLLLSQVKEGEGHEGLVLISALPARSIRRVRRPGAHLQALRGTGVLKQRVPLRPPVRSRALHPVTRRAGRGRVRSPGSSGQGTAAPSCLIPAGRCGARAAATPASASAGPWRCRGGNPAPSPLVPSAVQPRGRRVSGRQVCPARRHRARRPPP